MATSNFTELFTLMAAKTPILFFFRAPGHDFSLFLCWILLFLADFLAAVLPPPPHGHLKQPPAINLTCWPSTSHLRSVTPRPLLSEWLHMDSSFCTHLHPRLLPLTKYWCVSSLFYSLFHTQSKAYPLYFQSTSQLSCVFLLPFCRPHPD